MPVVQVHEALGSFQFEILANVPREVLDGIQHFSHIAVVPGRMDPRQYGDGTLAAARYVGVLRRIKYADDGRTNLIQDDIRLEGVGMEFWLGDDDNKGYIIETLKDYTAESFATVINDLLPASVTAGAIGLGDTGETATAAGNSLTPDYLVTADADAADITIGDTFHLYDVGGFLKEGTVFTVTNKASAFGFTNIEFSPNAAGITNTGDQLRVGVFGTYSGRHHYETPRSAIQYVCQTMSTTETPIGYRVTNEARLNAGPEEDLFVTNPQCIIMRKGSTQGEDMFMRALPSTVDMDEDMEDFATRVIMLAESDGDTFATGTADIATVAPGVNVFKDLKGNDLVLAKLVSESDTLVENADTRAELALREVIEPHRTLTLAADDYDIHGTFETGDYIWVYDPDAGLVDSANEVYVRGIRVNPIKLRVTEVDWPITDGYTVAHRDANGNWTDLTDYIRWEEQQTSRVVVGDFNRELTGSSNPASDRTGAVTGPDTTVPGQVDWVTGSFQTTNYSDNAGQAKARQKLVWNQPLNVNGTAITDGSHYEIQYKLDTGSQYSQTWAAASTLTWDEANTWNQPVEPDDVQWQTINIPWGDTSTVIHELPVGTGFDYRIRAVDKGANQGAWSITETWITSEDNIPPSPPAAPVVAGSAIAIQVVHELGKASGGTFNLEPDLAQLEIHYSQDEGFFPSDATLAGRLRADKGMMMAGTAAIGTFPVPETDAIYVKVVAVDLGGNRSSASAASQVTAELIDSQYISELTASKISAGTLQSNIILSASIKTAEEGQRVELNSQGLQAYDADGELTINLTANPTGGDYLTLMGADGTPAASIADTGDASFANVYADQAVYIDGASVQEMIDARPRGILAMTVAPNNSSLTTEAATAGGAVWNRIVVTNFDPTRQYRVSYRVRVDVGDLAPSYVGMNCYYAWDRRATNLDNDGTLFGDQFGGRSTSTTDVAWSGSHSFQNDTPSGTDMHLGFYVVASIAGIAYQGQSQNRVFLEDIGLAIPYDTFDPSTEGGGSDGGSTPVQTYTKTYSNTWSRSYNGSGALLHSNDEMYQGYYSGTNGNQRSLIGFNYATIQSDLAGATIKKVELTMKNVHFYQNSGGTAVIGTHSYTSAPSTWSTGSVIENRETESWAKGATKTVTLSNSFGTDLQSGAARGIAIGPGNSTSNIYYGYFDGRVGQPKLKITYTK